MTKLWITGPRVSYAEFEHLLLCYNNIKRRLELGKQKNIENNGLLKVVPITFTNKIKTEINLLSKLKDTTSGPAVLFLKRVYSISYILSTVGFL